MNIFLSFKISKVTTAGLTSTFTRILLVMPFPSPQGFLGSRVAVEEKYGKRKKWLYYPSIFDFSVDLPHTSGYPR